MHRNAKRLIAAAAVLLVVAGAAVYWFVIRDTSEKKLALRSDAPSKSSSVQSTSPTGLDGQWTVQPGTVNDASGKNTLAGYRVKESFVGGLANTTATGRTPDVSGTLTVQTGKVTAGTITVGLTTLMSDKPQRDAAIRARGLETTKFPTATFAISAPVTLPKITPGQVFTAQAKGKLTLHGVTRDVDLQLQAKQTNDRFLVNGEILIKMADYQIQPPSIGGFVSVEDNGSLEFVLQMAKS